MTGIDFAAPTSVEDAIALLAGDKDARLLAGGTDLSAQMRSGRVSPSRVVDIKRIHGISGISRRDGHFVIGAATPCAALGEHAALRAAWPGVVEAANLIGSTQVQSRATVAGNLCNASPAADSVPAMIAAGARCVIVGPSGRRELPVEALPVGPGRNGLAAGEFVFEILIPESAGASADAYLRAIPRTEMDIAVVGAGVSLTLDASGVCTAARVSLGAVAPTALLVAEAGAVLVGNPIDDAVLDRVAEAARAACRPVSDKRGTAEYRVAMAGVLARRATAIANERARNKA